MKKGSLVLLVLSVMLVTFVRFNISSVQPTFTVTETSTEITVENDFFKAVFDVDPANKHGKIRWFYIKPDDTVNIVATSFWEDMKQILNGEQQPRLEQTGQPWKKKVRPLR